MTGNYLLCMLLFQVITSVASSFKLYYPDSKTWWAKEVTFDLYTAGRLTERQIKYASEVGFESLISLPTFNESEWLGEERLPSTEEEQLLVSTLTNMNFSVILAKGEDTLRSETIREFTEVYLASPKPVLFHCKQSYEATLVALLYHVNQTRHDSSHKPHFDSREFYRIAASFGFDFTRDEIKTLVASLSGEDVIQNPPTPDVSNPNWLEYWHVKPLYKNWYVAGQIQSNHIPLIDKAGFTSIINTRRQVTEQPGNVPSQEEVTLLNIQGGTGTYTDGGRQRRANLEKLILDPSKPTSYISADSTVNYQSRNHLEWGDDIGYNETKERLALQGKIKYYSTPVSIITGDVFDGYLATWLQSASDMTIIHCTVAHRTTVAGLLIVGHQEGFNSSWAMKRADEMGFHFGEAGHDFVLKVFKEVLDKPKYDDAKSGSVVVSSSATGFLVGIVLCTLRRLGRI